MRMMLNLIVLHALQERSPLQAHTGALSSSWGVGAVNTKCWCAARLSHANDFLYPREADEECRAVQTTDSQVYTIMPCVHRGRCQTASPIHGLSWLRNAPSAVQQAHHCLI